VIVKSQVVLLRSCVTLYLSIFLPFAVIFRYFLADLPRKLACWRSPFTILYGSSVCDGQTHYT